jgi:hypothetical protein
MTTSHFDEPILGWLIELADDADSLPQAGKPRRYWSQRGSSEAPEAPTFVTIVHRVRALIDQLTGEHLFARELGYDCVDGNGESDSSPALELETRVGKPDLWMKPDKEWTEDDLCDVIEVFHDLAARPVRGWFHSFSGCGFHPERFHVKSGQELYRWRVNGVLESTRLGLRIADDGEDIGQVVRVSPDGLAELTEEVLHTSEGPARDDVEHAVAMFRARASTRSDRRSAVVTLAGILEQRRRLIKESLYSSDEGALFQIANNFDLRHRNDRQRDSYDDAFLEWIFYWYLSTIQLTNRLLAVKQGIRDSGS